MPTGSTAKPKQSSANGSLSRRVRTTETLLNAWQAIRRNGETSRSPKTRAETKDFAANLPLQIRRIQERLRRPPYQFAPQVGATPEKAKGKGKRPLVIAPLEDRIVQRAILDVLQTSPHLPGIQEVLSTETSIGGIPGRGVGHAIALIENAHTKGNANFVAGSDISGFFTRINQTTVIEFIACQTTDSEFIELIRRALRVELSNADQMTPDELRLFPTDETGVAQGCPLSALAGNIALRDFDIALNSRGICCIRYIDDFILLGNRGSAVRKAFESASEMLATLGMSTYQPTDRPDKAFAGPFQRGFDFLGYRLIAGTYPPASKNQERLLISVKAELDEGRGHILQAINRRTAGKPLQLYAQTLVAVDGLLRAWSGSFSASKCEATARAMDIKIDALISDFIAFYRHHTNDKTQTERRRILGVHVIEDDIDVRKKRDAHPP